jgi:hypothetical protein
MLNAHTLVDGSRSANRLVREHNGNCHGRKNRLRLGRFYGYRSLARGTNSNSVVNHLLVTFPISRAISSHAKSNLARGRIGVRAFALLLDRGDNDSDSSVSAHTTALENSVEMTSQGRKVEGRWH